MKLDWFTVTRDALMILVLTFAVVMGTAAVLGALSVAQAQGIIFVTLSAGFCAAGALKGEGRLAHLAVVATVVLAGTLLNSVSRGLPFESWGRLLVQGILPVAAAAVVGGAVSLAVKGTPDAAESSEGGSSGKV